MERKINKCKLDELIRLERKYCNTGDVDILPARIQVAMALSVSSFGNDNMWIHLADFVGGVISGLNKSASNEVIYGAFRAIGYEIAEE